MGCNDGSIRVWDLDQGREINQFRDHEKCVLALSLSVDGRVLVSVGQDKVARVWDTRTGKVTARFRGHTAPIDHVRLASHGRWVATTGDDLVIKIWSTDKGKELLSFDGHPTPVSGMDVSAEGARIITVAGQDSAVRVWDVLGRKSAGKFEGHPPPVRGPDEKIWYHGGVRLLAEDRWLATLGWDSTLRLWSMRDGREEGRWDLPAGGGLLAPSADGRAVALALEGGRLAILRFDLK